MRYIQNLLCLLFVMCIYLTMTCSCRPINQDEIHAKVAKSQKSDEVVTEIIPGAERIAKYYPQLSGKRVGLVVNQTSMVEGIHLIDTLLQMNVPVQKIFAPEHGFRGEADAGEHVKDNRDEKTGLPIISLHGDKRGPDNNDLSDIDIMVFDIQDVGVRFYTYISTLHYVMQACAENNVKLIVLDRPNPNGHYIDGPIMESQYKSFIGMHPVPVVHGMTIGEYAQMINGEAWLKHGLACELEVIPCNNYTHDSYYNLPIKPSPNLPNIQSIFLYPSLCFFEGTNVSVGRGTDMQFQLYGHPAWDEAPNKIKVVSKPGAKYPKHENKTIGYKSFEKLTKQELKDQASLNLDYLIEMYQLLKQKGEPFFLENNFFEKLAGTKALRNQLEAGKSAEEIRATWAAGLAEYDEMRKEYLIYE